MNGMAALPVAIPLLMAAVLVGAAPLPRRWVSDAVTIATTAAVTVICAILTWQSVGGTIVYWFGGWWPRGPMALGIGFAIDPLGAGLATMVAGLVTAAMVFSVHYFKAVRTLYHALMLVFLASMAGFCLTGDLFNMFVFFELMSVVAYVLTAYKIEEPSALEGSINIAVTNSIGAFWVLAGIGLLYGRTGALNMAQIARALADGRLDGLVIVAMALLFGGYFVKAAIVPFHFWLPDAHAVAPAPVSVLFSGVMVELGLYGVFRVYAAVFQGAMAGHEAAIRGLLVATGTLTAVVGGLYCFSQRHIKRMLASSTVSHMGMLLAGAGMLTGKAVGGFAIYILSHGMIKGALFMGSGILLHRLGSVDEMELKGRGRGLWRAGVLFVVAGLGLAGLPPFGTYVGKSLMEESAQHAGYGWMPWLFVLGSVLTAGAVLRVTGRVFLGWGPSEDVESGSPTEEEEPETEGGKDTTPRVMVGTAAVLVVVALLAGVFPQLMRQAARAGERFVDWRGYAERVMEGKAMAGRPEHAEYPAGESLVFALGSVIGAAGLAAAALMGDRLTGSVRKVIEGVARPVVGGLNAVHSGHVGDYVAWLVVGVAVFGGCLAVLVG